MLEMKLVATVLVVVVLGGVSAVGGYLVGRSGGPDLDAARAAGAREGAQAGSTRGTREGYQEGFRQARRRAYEASYERARKRAYRRALEAGQTQ